uniref:Cytosolic fatty-acid binding proteins domain-containing protein n=1 Tax=Panagrolaimus davidi TaxID=227884 RepID=A0A914R162_9BILA
MTEQFAGRWISESSENVEAFMQALGSNWIMQKLASNLPIKIEMEVKIDGNHGKINIYTIIKNFNLEFELGKEFEDTGGDGKKKMSTFTFEEGKLIKIEKATKVGEKDTKNVTFIENGKMIQIAECDGVKCTRTFIRV